MVLKCDIIEMPRLTATFSNCVILPKKFHLVLLRYLLIFYVLITQFIPITLYILPLIEIVSRWAYFLRIDIGD
jgi:hypothetical protein